MVVVKNEVVDNILNALLENSSTGLKGEGKIFIYDLDDAVDIGSRTRGESAI